MGQAVLNRERLRVYVAGPLSAPPAAYLTNLRRMTQEAIFLWEHGMAPYCPGSDIMYGLSGSEWGHEEYKAFNIPWLLACDAVYAYESSPGVEDEVRVAQQHGIPVFRNWGELLQFKREHSHAR